MADPSLRSGQGLPSGTVTFLFTDIEGSTARWEHRPEAMAVALARHDALLRAAIREHGGHVVKTMGDAFHAAFSRAPDALAAALAAQRRLHAEAWGEIGPLRVRMALHTGAAEERDGDYYGPPLNRAARLLSGGHGGQVLLSQTTYDLVRDVLPEGTALVDLGEHRLKDLTRPERIFQVLHPELPDDFPALASLDSRVHNLPIQPTSLIGREHEIAVARNLILGRGVRLLTLTGPGGTGKTRVGLQAAAELIDHFADGVFFVALAAISDPELVPSTIAQTLGIRDMGGRPVLESLREHLRDRQLLLLLDNFEQLLPAGPVVGELLGASPGLRVLVTSRAPLRVRGEQEFPVPPLALPDPHRLPPAAGLSQYAAVALFIERAAAIKPDFAVTNENAPAVAEICSRLDGLPLAIELAAGRIRLLSPQAMLARLERRLPLLTGGARDLPERQQTLRDTIGWSYDLLDEGERRLFRRLAVFVGGCTLEAAEVVGNPDADPTLDVLDGLASLVGKCLLRQEEGLGGEPRFGMLETIREYGLEQLEASGEAARLRRRHAEYFLALVERVEPNIKGAEPGEAEWVARLEREHPNLRAALSSNPDDAGSAEIEMRLAGALAWFWFMRGHISEGRGRVTQALARRHRASPALLGKLLRGAGNLALQQGDYSAASALLGESLANYRRTEERDGTAWTLSIIGLVAQAQGRHDRAHEILVESLALFRAAGDAWGTGHVLSLLGRVAIARDDYPQAAEFLRESLALRREDDKGGIGVCLAGLGELARQQADYPKARVLLGQSLSLFQEVGSLLGIAGRLEDLARLALAQEQYERAARLLAAAAGLRDAIGTPLPPAQRRQGEEAVTELRRVVGEQAFAAAWTEGQAMSFEQAVAYALGTATVT